MHEQDINEILKQLAHSLSPEGKAEQAEANVERGRARDKMLQDIREYIAEGNGRAVASIVQGLLRCIETFHQDGNAGEVFSRLCGIYNVTNAQIIEAAHASDPPSALLQLFR